MNSQGATCTFGAMAKGKIGGAKRTNLGGAAPRGVQKKRTLSKVGGGKGKPGGKGKLGQQRLQQPKKPTGGGGGRKTLMVSQPLPSKASRTWSEHNSVAAACDALVDSYESELRRLNPRQDRLTYTAADLNQWIDSHSHFTLLEEQSPKHFVSKGKDFMKAQLLSRLKSSAK